MIEYPRGITNIKVLDYETANLDSKNNQGAAKAVEYSCIEFTPNFEMVPSGKHHKMVRLPLSVIPSPGAYGVTGIDPIASDKVGMTEFEFADWLHQLYMEKPNTCIMGYNNISFDDEVTRHTMYRNCLPPYQHEFNRGNFRLDLYKVVQLCYAMKPEIIEWPLKEDGTPSLKLEELTKVNGISHEHAHSAESDVLATAELAKLIATRAPKMWEHAVNLTDKNYVSDLMFQNKIFFSIERFHGINNCLGKVMAVVITNPQNKNSAICVDLNADPSDFDAMFERSAEELKRLKFTKNDEKDQSEIDVEVPMHAIATNKFPMVVAANERYLESFKDRFNLDIERIKRNFQKLMSHPEFKRVAQEAFATNHESPKAYAHQLYAMPGFPSRETTKLLSELHRKDRNGSPRILSASIAEVASKTEDPARWYDITLMAKWDNYYEYFLDPSNSNFDKVEFVDWVDRVEDKLERGWDGTLTIEGFKAELNQFLKENALSEEKQTVIDNLGRVVDDKGKLLDGLKETRNELREEAELQRSNRPDYKAFYAKMGRSRGSEMTP